MSYQVRTAAGPELSGSRGSPPRRAGRAGATMVTLVLAAADFLAVMDGLLVAVVLPDIGDALQLGPTGLAWVITAYVLPFAGLMLVAGRLADRYGRRRLLLVGYAVFAGGSLVCGLADSGELLYAGRFLQGVGAALITPAGMSLLSEAFPAGPRRERALSVWAAAGSVGIPAGALVGAAVGASAGWRWVLLCNAPLALAMLVISWIVLPESRQDVAERRVNLVGGALLTGVIGGVVVLMTALGELAAGSTHAWGLGGVAVLAVLTALAAAVLWVRDRDSDSPVLPLGLLRVSSLRWANAAACGLPVGLGAMMFVGTQTLQTDRGFGLVATGAAYLALAVPVVIGSALTARAINVLGVRRTAEIGFAFQAIGVLTQVAAAAAGLGTWAVLLGFAVTGVGAPLAYIPVASVAVDDVGDQSGLASGLFNTTQQVANAVAMTMLGAAIALGLATGLGPAPNSWGYLVAAVLLSGAGLAATRLPDRDASTSPALSGDQDVG